MPTMPVDENLCLIPLDQNLPGFTNFVGTWLYRGAATILIDCGPAATIPFLKKSLDHMGIEQLDAVLLTHIHIDHAGGAGHLAQLFDDLVIICHDAAIDHLAQPARLWAGSLKTLGPIAEAYRPIAPTPREMLVAADQYDRFGIRAIATPGHAPHHVSYRLDRYLFAGEAGGVFLDTAGAETYLRPATPPRFFMDVSMASIDRLIQEPFDTICYGHFGVYGEGHRMLKRHRRQLSRWERIVGDLYTDSGGECTPEECLSRLLAEDPELASYSTFHEDVQARERYFLLNSIRGFLGYIGEKGMCSG